MIGPSIGGYMIKDIVDRVTFDCSSDNVKPVIGEVNVLDVLV